MSAISVGCDVATLLPKSEFNAIVTWMQVMHGTQIPSGSAEKQKIWERPARLTPNLLMHARDRFA